MQIFSQHRFHLRTASIETRVAYTGFLILLLPGVATLVALSFGRLGLSPQAIATYYRGGESEMSFPKTFWQLMEVSHAHLFTVPVVVLILSHLLYGTPLSVRLRLWLTALMVGGALLDALGPWAIRFLSGYFAYALLAGWGILAGGTLLIIALTLVAMWGPKRWIAWWASSIPAAHENKS